MQISICRNDRRNPKNMLSIYLFRKNLIVKKLYQCGAFNEETTKTLE